MFSRLKGQPGYFYLPKMLLVFVLVFLSNSGSGAEIPIRWIPFPDPAFEVNGLYWFPENSPELFRLPLNIKDQVSPSAWNRAKCPSGGRIRFRSDCTTLAIRLEYQDLDRMHNMHTFGQSGIDLYVDGNYVRTAVPGKSTYLEFTFFENISSRLRELTLYLPLYKGVRVIAIGMNSDASIEPAQPFSVHKPVAFYGTSITRGGCASRPGMIYEAILCRRLNIDFINLGGINGRGVNEMAEILSKISASCYVLDYAVNNRRADSLAAHYGPFLDILRKNRPVTPIIAITPIYFTRNNPLVEDNTTNAEMRDVIRSEVTKRIREGDKNLILIEGTELLGMDLADALTDGIHPNTLGMQIIADRLLPTLIDILHLAQVDAVFK